MPSLGHRTITICFSEFATPGRFSHSGAPRGAGNQEILAASKKVRFYVIANTEVTGRSLPFDFTWVYATRVSQPASSMPGTTEVFCVFCGSGNPRANARCSQCGRDLFLGSSESEPQVKAAQSSSELPAREAPSKDHSAVPAHPRAINTKQMIVLWYGAVACVVVAVLSGSSTVGALVAVLMLTGMSVLTLSHHPNVRKKIVAVWVIGSILLLILVVAGFIYFSRPSNRQSAVSPNSIALFDLNMSLSYNCGQVTGRVRNQSEKTLKSIKFRVTLSDSTGPIDGADASVFVEVPPGETRSFNANVCGLRESPGWTWNYSVLEVQGE